jgi:hypothetical protein
MLELVGNLLPVVVLVISALPALTQIVPALC